MHENRNYEKLAQSASSLGAALLGFGIGGIAGNAMDRLILVATLVIGAVIHLAGMYVIQIKNVNRAGMFAKILWLSAWICLLAVVAIVLYLIIQ
jgi:hypothetical protein